MLGKRQAFPAIRRMAMAQLVKAWLTTMARQLPEQYETTIQGTFRVLYEAHRVAALRKGIMEYFHISKAGGTSWCHAAKNNGCRAQVYDSAYICQISQLDDRVRWLNNTFHAKRTGRGARWGTWGRVARDTKFPTCESRHDFAAAMGYQYFSNEFTLHEGLHDTADVRLCEQFFNVILIRDPLKRMLSHLKFVTMQMKWDYRNDTLFHNTYWGTDAAFWESFGPVLVDNYMLRGMLGEKAYHAPIGSFGPREMEQGRALLQQYDLIVDLEAGHDAVDDVMQLGVGWPHTLREIHDKDSVKAAARLNLTYEDYLPRDLDRLYEKQGPDVGFYRFGKVLVRLDSLLFSSARSLGMRPLLAAPLEELAEAPPERVACGLMRRGPRHSNSTADRWQDNEYAQRINAEMAAARKAAQEQWQKRMARAKAHKAAQAAARAAAEAAVAAAQAAVAAAEAANKQVQGGGRRAVLAEGGVGMVGGVGVGGLEGRGEAGAGAGRGVRRAMVGMAMRERAGLGADGGRALRAALREAGVHLGDPFAEGCGAGSGCGGSWAAA
ncbi:hypothetical protein HYH03_012494 [Edaphochlamys debaryana]|uniref:Uncharacterized protein n=1 Tax=Edaphochlamys debaryana TaxID=47281 RepID=A0A836BVH6_9CHLO|nr:hypothetical protein HYH03_012494 [Edaphochlamys debaryana]|eukprot:KAG2489058.1 hypothetical protein HYH03_012494 [Edaphochlamys debaryana]